MEIQIPGYAYPERNLFIIVSKTLYPKTDYRAPKQISEVQPEQWIPEAKTTPVLGKA